MGDDLYPPLDPAPARARGPAVPASEPSLVSAIDAPDLTGLGLVMMLGADLFLAFSALMAFSIVLLPGGGAGKLFLFLAYATGAVRSIFHRAAAQAVLFGLPGGGVRRIRKYLLVAGIHVAFVLYTLRELGVLGLGFALVPLMVAWPLVLLAISESPRLRAALEEPTLGPDRGLQAAGNLMVVLGTAGALLAALLGYGVAQSGLASTTVGLALLVAAAALVARSVVHVLAGRAAVLGPGSEAFRLGLARYGTLGTVGALIAGIPFLLLAIEGPAHPVPFLLVGTVVWMLLVWPTSIRHLVAERLFSVLLEGRRRVVAAPDAGVSALGWLAVAGGVLGLGASVGGLLAPASRSLGTELAVGFLMTDGAGLVLALSIVQLAAGVQIALGTRFRLQGALAYGALGTAVSVWQIVESGTSHGATWQDLGSVGGTGVVLLSVCMPVLTAALVWRAEHLGARAGR